MLWKAPNDHGHDVQALPNGHVLFTINPQKKVVELDGDHKEVWTYSEGLEHPDRGATPGERQHADQRRQAGESDRSDRRTSTWSGSTRARTWPTCGRAMRTARTQGTTLIAVEAEGKLIEVDQAGKIVWQWQAPNGKNRKLYMGRRLANGNTVMSLSDPGELVEVDRSGKIVRSHRRQRTRRSRWAGLRDSRFCRMAEC